MAGNSNGIPQRKAMAMGDKVSGMKSGGKVPAPAPTKAPDQFQKYGMGARRVKGDKGC